ncbi:chaperonin 10-like protein [Mycena amicta]|nr:chaperonin 10-like protein [Mycena amicta]
MPTHTAIAATAKGTFDAIQVETPTSPGPGKVLVRVAYASMVAFDTYITDLGIGVVEYPVVLGLNVAGTVKHVGEGVEGLQEGDRKDALQGTLQEYLVLPSYLCAKIPDTLPLDAAATIPDNFITAFYTLFDQLGLPIPQESFPATSSPPNHDIPIFIYGAGATNGQYALQLLHLAGYTNVLATASPRHHALLQGPGFGAKHVFDYRSPSLARDIKAALGGDHERVAMAVDAVSAEDTVARIGEVLSPQGSIAVLLPIKEGDAVATGNAPMHWELRPERNPFSRETKVAYVRTFLFDQNEYLKENLMPKILPQLLSSNLIQPNRVHLLDQGTLKDRVSAGLDLLRNNKISGEKVVVKVMP